MKGISRIDSRKCHGWFVRIYRGDRTISKLFSDKKNGGKIAARMLAVDYHRKLEISFPRKSKQKRLSPPYIIGGRLSKANKSGVNGVCFVYNRERRKKHIGYAVNYLSKGKQNNKRFTFLRFGNKRKTFQVAVSFRKRMERVMLREWKKNGDYILRKPIRISFIY